MLMNYLHNNNYFYNVLVTIVETEQRLEKNKYMLKNTYGKNIMIWKVVIIMFFSSLSLLIIFLGDILSLDI